MTETAQQHEDEGGGNEIVEKAVLKVIDRLVLAGHERAPLEESRQAIESSITDTLEQQEKIARWNLAMMLAQEAAGLCNRANAIIERTPCRYAVQAINIYEQAASDVLRNRIADPKGGDVGGNGRVIQ